MVWYDIRWTGKDGYNTRIYGRVKDFNRAIRSLKKNEISFEAKEIERVFCDDDMCICCQYIGFGHERKKTIVDEISKGPGECPP